MTRLHGPRDLAASDSARRLFAGCVLALVGLLAACNAPTPWADPTAAVATPTRAASPAPAVAATADGLPRFAPSPAVSPEALVALAVADAARRTNVAASAVSVVLIEPREWPDRSLGCPEPGMGYAQSITPGFMIVVEAGGRRLRYHTDHAQARACDMAP